MKIRTFLTCEDIDIPKEDSGGTIIIKNMMSGIRVRKLPSKESIIVLITLDEPSSHEVELHVAMLNSKDKFLSEWKKKLPPQRDAFAFRLTTDFHQSGKHFIKVTADGDFLGKYPFEILLPEEDDQGEQ
ncbi:hypothetical protein ACTNDP_16225 [Paenibacillus barengoltzii]|uniref:hypothetical protein n=1 Tax=Paenibacillus TaxID=44249 RepID=UPI0028FD1585|nr:MULTISPECIES: hypothetical protein [Paenibacillus]MDU0331958.1 hypothetical protein [Paenibacillus sp. 3LSP]MEC2345955.1 hypothetical protein [Paenibacillus barengoltzii]